MATHRTCTLCKLSKASGHFDTEDTTICSMCRRLAVAPKPGRCQVAELRVLDDGTVWAQVTMPNGAGVDELTRVFNECGYAGDTAPTDQEHNYQAAVWWAQQLMHFQDPD